MSFADVAGVAIKAAPAVYELIKALGVSDADVRKVLQAMLDEPPRAVNIDRVKLEAIAAGNARESEPPRMPSIVLDSAARFLDGFHGTEAEAVELADAIGIQARKRAQLAAMRNDI